jgi:hypothetical protein
MEHDVQSNIHKDEHVDTDVKTRQLGDTEVIDARRNLCS